MPSTSDDDPKGEGVAAHLRQALEHGLQGLRCYLALLVADTQQRIAKALGQAIWAIALAVAALLGGILFVCGLAIFVERCVGVPGAGLMIIGGAILAAVFVAISLRKRRGQK